MARATADPLPGTLPYRNWACVNGPSIRGGTPGRGQRRGRGVSAFGPLLQALEADQLQDLGECPPATAGVPPARWSRRAVRSRERSCRETGDCPSVTHKESFPGRKHRLPGRCLLSGLRLAPVPCRAEIPPRPWTGSLPLRHPAAWPGRSRRSGARSGVVLRRAESAVPCSAPLPAEAARWPA